MQKWEYLLVHLREGKVKSWSGMFVTNVARQFHPIPESGIPIWDFVDQLGEEGWELAGTLAADSTIG